MTQSLVSVSALPLRLCGDDWNVAGKTAETGEKQRKRREELRDLLFF
jgi:hypothetical protein